MSEDRVPKPRDGRLGRTGVADAAGWLAAEVAGTHLAVQSEALGHAATEAADRAATHAARITELAANTPSLQALAERWGGTSNAQFAGRLFEWWHQATANMDAAGQGSSTRAYLTEFGNPFSGAAPHDPADLRLYDQGGTVLGEVQLKSVVSTAARVIQLADEKYEGMQLIVPSDQVEATRGLIAARVTTADPNFLKAHAYQGVNERLDDRVRIDGITSEPIDSTRLAAATDDPQSLARELQDREGAAQQNAASQQSQLAAEQLRAQLASVGVAGLAGGATQGAVTLMISGIRSTAAIRAKTMSPTAAALTSLSDAAAGFARGSYVGATGQGISLLARNGALPEALEGGTLPFAIARASLSLGQISVNYARGQITGPEAAAQSAESMTRISFIWAAGIIGQAAIPIPVVGAMVGATVGSLCATAAVNGLSCLAGLAADAHAEEDLLNALQVEIAAALIVMAEEARWLDEIAKSHDVAFRDIILPSLDHLDEAVLHGDPWAALESTSAIITAHGGQPLFLTRAEFDSWMRDTSLTLLLTTNPRSGQADTRPS